MGQQLHNARCPLPSERCGRRSLHRLGGCCGIATPQALHAHCGRSVADEIADEGALQMLRSAIAGILIYGYGHPGLEALRPAFVDHALQGFHRDVNTVVADAYFAVTRIDDERVIAAARGYAGHLETQLRAKD
jgi:hypothetical protein